MLKLFILGSIVAMVTLLIILVSLLIALHEYPKAVVVSLIVVMLTIILKKVKGGMSKMPAM